MSELVLEVLLVVFMASTVAGNAFYVWYLYKEEQHSAELAERLERLREGEDDETTD